MYTQDYDETLPGNSQQATAQSSPTLGFMITPDNSANRRNIVPRDLQPYVKNIHIFHCPSVPDRTDAPGYANPATNGANSSYQYNGIVMWRPLAVIPEPANTIFIHEHNLNMGYVQESPCLTNFGTNITGQPNQLFIRFNWSGWMNVHNRGGNYVFNDGHVKWQKKTGTRLAQFGAQVGTGANQVNPPDRTLVDDTTNGNPEAVAEGRNLILRAAF
jgi:prepilin-type processing-associated H-X9-DG protein